MSLLTRAQAALKAWTFGGQGGPWYLGSLSGATFGTYSNSTIDYQAEAGDLRHSTIIMACVQWIQTAFPEAPTRVLRAGDPVPNHPLTGLLATPNPYYSGMLLWQATVADYNIAGNAYWVKVRGGGGRVVELWWEPSWSIRPTWPKDGSAFLAGYQVYRGGHWIDLPREDVIHFRFGLDPQNTRLGLSPLAAALREVYTDNEAAAYIAALLRNGAVPPVVIAPKGDNTISDPESFKSSFMARFGGDHRGEPVVLSSDISVNTLAFPPSALNLQGVRVTPEERISALLRVNAMVAGLGAGLARSTYSNYAEAREAAYETNIVPTWRLFAADLTTQLLPDLGQAGSEIVDFDTSQVRALADDQTAKYQRLSQAFQGGWITRAEARQADGLEVDDARDAVFLVPRGMTVIPADAPWVTPDPVQPAGMPPLPPGTPAEQPPALRRLKALPVPLGDALHWDAAALLDLTTLGPTDPDAAALWRDTAPAEYAGLLDAEATDE